MSREVLHQASCVAIAGRALLIEGPPGSGKSSLALAMIDRGAKLVGDDGVQLQREGDTVIASPPPNISGLLEIRNVGLVKFPTTSARLAVILTFTDEAPRFIEQAGERDVLGIQIPHIFFRPGDAVQAIRAEWALKQHGIPISD